MKHSIFDHFMCECGARLTAACWFVAASVTLFYLIVTYLCKTSPFKEKMLSKQRAVIARVPMSLYQPISPF